MTTKDSEFQFGYSVIAIKPQNAALLFVNLEGLEIAILQVFSKKHTDPGDFKLALSIKFAYLYKELSIWVQDELSIKKSFCVIIRNN